MIRTQNTRKLCIIFPDPEPSGAIPPTIGFLFNTGDPLFLFDASGIREFEPSDRIVLKFTDHRAGQIAALLPSIDNRDVIRRIHVASGVIAAADLAAISDARIPHLILGVGRIGLTLEPASIVFEDDTDLSELKHIVQFESTGVPLTDAHLKSLGSPGELQFVNFDGARITPRSLVEFPYLKHIHVSGDPAFGADLSLLAKLPGLETIGIRHAGLTREALKTLRRIRRLWMLDLAYNKDLVVDLAALVNAGGLTYLDLSGTAADNSTIRSLPDAPRLTTLNLQSTRITHNNLKRLWRLPRLSHLDVAGTNLCDYGLKKLTVAVPNLRYLDIRNAGVTEDGMRHLSQLKQLVTLGVTGKVFTIEVAERLKTDTKLAEVLTCAPYPSDDFDGVLETARAVDWFGAWKTVGRPL